MLVRALRPNILSAAEWGAMGEVTHPTLAVVWGALWRFVDGPIKESVRFLFSGITYNTGSSGQQQKADAAREG